ncbi:hypothetical protein [Escherichia coli]|uniref:hypothetical protein n=1 Tax=Escherichia coli TaxID=562 RepID=UPI0038B3CC0E
MIIVKSPCPLGYYFGAGDNTGEITCLLTENFWLKKACIRIALNTLCDELNVSLAGMTTMAGVQQPSGADQYCFCVV